jgi:hypothetical protein
MNVLVTKEDLVGQIANFPLKIVEAMVANQVRQGNPANVKVFQEKVDASLVEGGFSWNKSAEGQFFWSKVINGKQFPKEIVSLDKSIEPLNESPEEVVKKVAAYKVGDVVRVKVGNVIRSRVIIGYFPKMPNPYLTITEESFRDLMNGKTSCRINVTAIEEPKRYVYLTLKDISEGKGTGIDPDLIRIVQ